MAKSTTNRAKVLGAAAGVVALVGVTACGGGDADAYCDTLESHAEELQALDDEGQGMEAMMTEGFDGLVSMLEDAESDVPEEIADEHGAVQEAVSELRELDLEALLDMENIMEMDEEEMAEMEAQFEEFEQRFEDIDEQGEAWGEWVEENCDMEALL